MATIVADYGSSESDYEEQATNEPEQATEPRSLLFSHDDLDEESESSVGRSSQNAAVAEKPGCIPLPGFMDARQPQTSVFDNPFRRAEEAQNASLERHVKLTDVPDKLRLINGRKVCWNYRKGRCRFGAKCSFAHDSELQRPAAVGVEQAQVCVTASDTPQPDAAPQDPTSPSPSSDKRKKRPGLGDSLKPGKKVMKMYKIENGQLT